MKNIHETLQNMTLEEKASLCSGKSDWETQDIQRLMIPSIMLTDGPHGLRKEVGNKGLSQSVAATCFPPAATTASSWNRNLLKEIGSAIGEECLQEDVAVILGPGVNIKRSPLCGRNFEYFSEDPYLAGELATNFIQGVQSKGIGTSLKHFAVNNQEYRRMTISTVIDERTLREIYLHAFENVVQQASPWMVMCSYNRINGEYCSENSWLLNQLLRDEWGFNGVLVTDWGACNNRVKGLISGQDLEMPSTKGLNDFEIVKAVQNGILDSSVLDQTVTRLLDLIKKTNESKMDNYRYNVKSHHELARRAAGESIVLLKNQDHILPLNPKSRIALIGAFAKHPRYQGSGCSLIFPSQLDNAHDEFLKSAFDITFAPGYDTTNNTPNEELIEDACNVARKSDIVVVFAGLTDLSELESMDRENLSLPESHNVLIERVAEANPNLVLVLSNGAPVEMPWLHSVKGILEGYLGGQAGGSAIVDVLVGRTNPSGKLAETFPIKLEDTPAYTYFPGGKKTVEYRESIYVGYRYYDTIQKPVLFPFGFGLSYTTFTYSNLCIDQQHINDNQQLKVKVTVKNTGGMAGAEIVQLYIHDKQSTVFRPAKELKGFEKVFLEPGEEKCIDFILHKHAFAFFNTCIDDWYVESGEFEILIGASSLDIHLKKNVYVESSLPDAAMQDIRNTAPEYYNLSAEKCLTIPDLTFKTLLGKEIPSNQPQPQEPFTVNSTLGDVKDTFEGRKLYNLILKQIQTNLGASENETLKMMAVKLTEYLPLRNMVSMSSGKYTFEMVNAFVLLINLN